MENEELYRSLVVLLRMFEDRPYHLAKYLVDNDAFTNDFSYKLKNSSIIKKINNNEDIYNLNNYFSNIMEMEKFYNTFLDDIKKLSKEKNIEEISLELNNKLNDLIKEEKYEEASRIRDYMIENNIKRKSN